MTFLTTYIARTRQLEWNTEVFEALFDDFDTYLRAPEVRVVNTMLLDGFDSELSDVPLEPDIQIIRLTSDMKRQLFEQYSEFGFVALTDLFDWTHALQVEFDKPKRPGTTGGSDVRLAPVIQALRLLKPGTFAPAHTWMRAARPTFERVGGLVSSGTRRAVMHGAYTLESDDVDELRELLARLRDYSPEARFTLALRRFDRLYGRESPEDKLIDCWVAFEALFLWDVSGGELRFRAGLRIARFLGDDPTERLELNKRVKSSYDARSHVLHGGDPLPNIGPLSVEAEEWLRRALRRWIDPTRSHSPVDIDSQLLA
jgi:hypothetical protein